MNLFGMNGKYKLHLKVEWVANDERLWYWWVLMVKLKENKNKCIIVDQGIELHQGKTKRGIKNK